MELFTVEEVAKQLKVDTETVYRWLKVGKLKGTKVGDSLWRIPESALTEFTQVSGKG